MFSMFYEMQHNTDHLEAQTHSEWTPGSADKEKETNI